MNFEIVFMTFHIPTDTLSEFSHIYDKKENPEQGSSQNPYPHKTKAGMLIEFHEHLEKVKDGFPYLFYVFLDNNKKMISHFPS